MFYRKATSLNSTCCFECMRLLMFFFCLFFTLFFFLVLYPSFARERKMGRHNETKKNHKECTILTARKTIRSRKLSTGKKQCSSEENTNNGKKRSSHDDIDRCTSVVGSKLDWKRMHLLIQRCKLVKMKISCGIGPR